MFETAIPGAGYGYGTQQVGPPLGTYGSLGSQYGQPAGLPGAVALGQPQFGGQAGWPGVMAQRFGGYPAPQSFPPLTIGPGAIPFQQIQPQFGQPQFGQSQFGQSQFGQSQFGQPQFGQPQFGQPQLGQPQFGGQQLGVTQPQVQLIPVVTPQGWIGLLLLATGQPLAIGPTVGGISGGLGQYPGYGYGVPQGMIGGGQVGLGGLGGGYLPLQVQQQIPQQVSQVYVPGIPIAGPSFPGQPLGATPIH
jgi:hypothetical protein